MKHTVYKILLTTFALLLFGVFANITQATTGGPTLVYDLKFDQAKRLIYYTEQDFGGRGCPAELKTVNLVEAELQTIYGCDNATEGQDQKIATFTSAFTNLEIINLRKNNFNISLEVTGEENIEDTSETLRTNFVAHVYQNGIEKAILPFSGCSTEQPLTVQGYSIPGVPAIIALLFSTKGDCIEGGYINETVHIVKGITLSNASPVFAFKALDPLVPNQATLTTYFAEQEENTPPPAAAPTTDVKTEGKNRTTALIVLTALISLIGGIALGRLSKRADTKAKVD